MISRNARSKELKVIGMRDCHMERAMGIAVRTLGKLSVQVRYYSGVQKQEVVPVSDTREKAYSFCSLGS